MTTWLFDLGNSRLKFAPLAADGTLGDVVAAEHDGEDFVGDWLSGLPPRIASACIASVAPSALHDALVEALRARGAEVSRVSTQSEWGDLRVAYPHPERLGVDRFLALLAARGRGRKAWLVAGVGTALTIDLLDADGMHRGGRIAPSPALMRDSLHRRASQLPLHGGGYREFADDTADGLASGCLGAAVALIERSLQQAQSLLGTTPALLLHGGGAGELLPLLDQAELASSLVLEGLARWAHADRG